MSSKKPSTSDNPLETDSLVNLSRVIQEIEHDIGMRGKTKPSNYLSETTGKFELYRVQNQFYLVTCVEPGYLSINPLQMVDYFPNVSRAAIQIRQCQATFPRSLVYPVGDQENKYCLVTENMVNDPNRKITIVRSLSKIKPWKLFSKVTESQSLEYASQDEVPQKQILICENGLKLQIEQVSGRPLDLQNRDMGYMEILQNVCRDIKLEEQQVGKFWLYVVSKNIPARERTKVSVVSVKQFYLVTCTESGCFSINPLKFVELFEHVRLETNHYSQYTAIVRTIKQRNTSFLFPNNSNGYVLVTPQNKRGKHSSTCNQVIGVNLLNFSKPEKLLPLVSQVTDPTYNVIFDFVHKSKPAITESRKNQMTSIFYPNTNIARHYSINEKLMQLYNSMCGVTLVPSNLEDSVKLEFWARLFEPLNLGQALKLQTSSDAWFREVIWQTKWMFSQKELKSVINEVSNEPSYQTANIIMVFIRSWIPYVRHFVLDQDPEEDIYTAIYLFVITHSPRLVRLNLQYSMPKAKFFVQIHIIQDYTLEILQKSPSGILPLSELFLPRDVIPKYVPNSSLSLENRLWRSISLAGGASCITRLEWPDLFYCFTEEQPIHFPNLRSLSLIYNENTNPLIAESFTKKNRTIVELDVMWRVTDPVYLWNFFINFLKPIQTTLRKFRLIFDWNLNKEKVQKAMNALGDFNQWQVDNVVHLELGLSNIPKELLSLFTVGLTSVPRLRTLVLHFGPGKLPEFPLPFSNKITENGSILENLVLNLKGSKPSSFKNDDRLIYLINGNGQTKLPVRNLTICDIKTQKMGSCLLQVALKNFAIHSALQIKGPMEYTSNDTSWTDMYTSGSTFNRLVLRCKNYPWLRQAFLFMRRKADDNQHHSELQNNGVLFYIDYKKVVKAEDKIRMNQEMKYCKLLFLQDYFRFH